MGSCNTSDSVEVDLLTSVRQCCGAGFVWIQNPESGCDLFDKKMVPLATEQTYIPGISLENLWNAWKVFQQSHYVNLKFASFFVGLFYRVGSGSRSGTTWKVESRPGINHFGSTTFVLGSGYCALSWVRLELSLPVLDPTFWRKAVSRRLIYIFYKNLVP